ncbi:glycerol-3-phosphate dehydrogenase/oxidase [Nakamurella deserti]|uniref:glycerol-3-phosphate dehydrogenase/oxidase n=1 Tax=Nakamurella deserti TaxID=2164074 RepID=UPI000DBEA30A|nr:glycerol-3-phosphate dehydrogenase/oxidase [Nakamurella deserti]
MVRPELTGEPFDVIVVGAGINGVGIAQDAALRGLRVVLVEQDDLCSGVSAWSGRLVHGGLRYLEQYDVPLVFESLNERERLFKLAPHLVKPKPLMVPVYKHNRRPGWMVELGMIAYDALSLVKTPPYHRRLSKKRTLQRFTGVGTDGLSGSVVFYDGQVENAERLCVELAVDAAAAGAVIATKTRVEAPLVERGRVVGVKAVDTLTGERFEIRGFVTYNVAGAAIDRLIADPSLPRQPRLNGGTKGSHLIVDPFPGAPTDVVYYESRQDGRLVLIIPWRGRYMIGTTDIRFDGDPDDARCDIGEVDYLLGEVNALIPEAGLTLDDVLYTFSGVRPLPYVPDKAESSVPRSHVLHDHAGNGLPGLVTIVGGKLTTYRQLAQDTVDDAFARLGRKAPPVPTKKRRYPGAQFVDLDTLKASVAGRTGLPADQATRLVDLYGSRTFALWQLVEHRPELNRVVHPSGVLAAELVFAVEEDLARSLTDVLARRVLLAFEPGHALEQLDDIAKTLADHLDWDDEQVRAQIAEYREWLDKLKVPDPDGPRSESFGAGVVVGTTS